MKYKGGKWGILKNPPADTSLIYQWWTNDKEIKHPIVEVVMHKDKPLLAKFIQAAPFEESLEKIKLNELEVFVVYPNPANSYINIKTTESEKYIGVYSMNGEQLKSVYSNEIITKINIDFISSGKYLVIARDKKGRIIGKSVFVKIN